MNTPQEEVFLVTGALGCIGSWAVRQLLDEGVRVVGFDAGTDRSRLDLVLDGVASDRLELLRGDITDLDQVRRALDRFDVNRVVHLAALQVPFCQADPPLGASVNVVGTVNVFEAVAERAERIPSVAYAGSVGMFDAADAQAGTGRIAAGAAAHPRSHYGVYKLANEGTARVYWESRGVASVGLRPFVVYGPGRDQGLTSSPTMAMLAAALGRPYTISYGGRVQFQFAGDAAAAFVAAARTVRQDAHTVNLGGPVAAIEDVVAAIEGAAPESAGSVGFDPAPLPFAESVDTAGIEVLGPLPATSLDEGVTATVSHFRRLHEAGRLPATLLAKLG